MKRRRTSIIIYDLDGTLVDSCPGIDKTFRSVASKILPDKEVPSLRPFIGPSIRGIIHAVFGELSEEQVLQIERGFRDEYDNYGCLNCALFPDVWATLENLRKKNMRQFIVTNKPAVPTKAILKKLNLDQMMEWFVAVDSVTPRFTSKTAATRYLLARRNIQPEQCVFVGDSLDDYNAAVSTGIKFIGVNYGYGSHSLPENIQKLHGLSDLPHLIAVSP